MRHTTKWMERDRAVLKTLCRKLLLSALLIAFVLVILSLTAGGQKLSLQHVQQGADRLRHFVNTCYPCAVIAFILCYVVFNLYLPAAAIMTLLGGYLFGTMPGILYVITGAVVASLANFWISRYLAGEYVQNRWQDVLIGFNENVAQFGPEYLILVRLIPMFPFVLVNVLAGLTRISVRTFIWTTIVGLLPGVVVFSYIGRRLQTLRSIDDILTWDICVAAMLLICIVLSFWFLRYIRFKRNGKVSRMTVTSA